MARGGYREGGGRPRVEVKRTTLNLSGKPDELERLRGYAKREHTSLSNLVISVMEVVMNYTDKEIVAMNKALDMVDLPMGISSIKENVDNGYLTINKGRDGKFYAWYFDGSRESCVEVETLQLLTREEIEQILE